MIIQQVKNDEPLANRDNENKIPVQGPEEEILDLLMETDD